jgi:hypothetical protein
MVSFFYQTEEGYLVFMDVALESFDIKTIKSIDNSDIIHAGMAKGYGFKEVNDKPLKCVLCDWTSENIDDQPCHHLSGKIDENYGIILESDENHRTSFIIKEQEHIGVWNPSATVTINIGEKLPQKCLHKSCPECHGTGKKDNGENCVHYISCPCPDCRPYCHYEEHG